MPFCRLKKAEAVSLSPASVILNSMDSVRKGEKFQKRISSGSSPNVNHILAHLPFVSKTSPGSSHHREVWVPVKTLPPGDTLECLQQVQRRRTTQSPLIWLCVQCGRCTEACSQLVDGCRMIASLRELAVHEGRVDADFALRVRDAQKEFYVRWVDAIDKLLAFKAGQGRFATCRLPVAKCA
jgi:ferredoxin